jgi:hypothetical protein
MLAVDNWRHVVEFTGCMENRCLRLVSRMFRSVLTVVACCIRKPDEQPRGPYYTNLFVHCSLSAQQLTAWIGHTRSTVLFERDTSDHLLMHHIRLALERCNVVVRVRNSIVIPTRKFAPSISPCRVLYGRPRRDLFCCVDNGSATATFMDEVRSLVRDSDLHSCTIQLSRCHLEGHDYFRRDWYDSFFFGANRYRVTLEHLTCSTVYMCLHCLLHGIKAFQLSVFRVQIIQKLSARDLIGCITQVVYFLQYPDREYRSEQCTVFLSFDGLQFEGQLWEIQGLAMSVRQLMCLQRMSVNVKFGFQSKVCQRLVRHLCPNSKPSFSVTVSKTEIVMQNEKWMTSPQQLN